MSHKKRTLLLCATCAAILTGAALAAPSSDSQIQTGPTMAQESDRIGNYQYMRDRRRGYDPRYQNPGTVYREEYKVGPNTPVVPVGPNDPRFQHKPDTSYNTPYIDPSYQYDYRHDPRYNNGYYDGNGNYRGGYNSGNVQRYDANGNPIANPNQPYYDANGNVINNRANRRYYDANGNPVVYPTESDRALKVGPFRVRY